MADITQQRPVIDRGAFSEGSKPDRSAFTEQARLDSEVLYVLAGRRNSQRREAAVRIEDLLPIIQMPPRMQSLPLTPGGPAPTAAQFNQLLADFKRLHTQIVAIAKVLQARLQP